MKKRYVWVNHYDPVSELHWMSKEQVKEKRVDFSEVINTTLGIMFAVMSCAVGMLLIQLVLG